MMRPLLALLLGTVVLLQDARFPATYRVFAVRYATLADFPVSSLVAGADPDRRADIAMMVWVLKPETGSAILFDAGFHGEQYIRQWKPRDFVRPDTALERFGIPPSEISDVIVSHVHWDHLDGAGLFPAAKVWLQKDQYEHYVGPDGSDRNRGIDARGAALLAKLHAEKRLMLVNGDEQEVLPGITAHTGGRHTYASQYITVRTPDGMVVLASDNLYLYENLERRVPIAQTVDAEANLRAQDRMRALVKDPRQVVPGHDPLVFERFPRVADGVVAIRR